MSKIRFVIALVLSMVISSGTLQAAEPPSSSAEEATLEVLLNAIRANRRALVSVNLTLTDEEATKFWPLYDRYQNEVNALGDRMVGVVQEYTASFRTLSDDKAAKLIEEYLTVEAERVALRRSYLAEFKKVLPGRKVARLYQIENKMEAVTRYDLAASIPVLEEAAGAEKKP